MMIIILIFFFKYYDLLKAVCRHTDGAGITKHFSQSLSIAVLRELHPFFGNSTLLSAAADVVVRN